MFLKKMLAYLFVAGAMALAACAEDDQIGSFASPTPDIGAKQTEAAIPAPTTVPGAPCSVEKSACTLVEEVVRTLHAGDLDAMLARAHALEVACPAPAPIKQVCEQWSATSVSGYSRVAFAKAYQFVPESQFLELTRADLKTLSADATVLSVACSSSAKGEPGSCAEFVTLALGDRADPANSPVLLLFYQEFDGGWALTGSARWHASGPAVIGGPDDIWVAGRDGQLQLWFHPLS